MYDIERQEAILNILRERKSCSVTELARRLSFSEATIRRDLNALDRDMKVRKTFGGAVIMEQYSTEVPISLRRGENTAAKEKLCAVAATLIRDNMTLFLGSSATVEYLVPHLKKHSGLTVVTNHPDIPAMLSGSDVTVYSTGGKYLHHSNAYVGEFARKMICGVNADLMFFSTRGVGLDGKLTCSSTEDDIHVAMMRNSAKVCLLADSSKFGKVFPFTICELGDVDIIATDQPLPEGLEHPCVLTVGGMKKDTVALEKTK